MIITRLRLSGVRRHEELDVELRPGLNIVRGPNEAGKSTIQRAIEMVLFRRPTFASAELDDIRPWRQPDAEPTIEIEFAAGARMRITGAVDAASLAAAITVLAEGRRR